MATQEKFYNRLFVVGCSFTSYGWPGYGEYLSTIFKVAYNYGKSGAGNTYIYNTVCNIFEKYKPDENDVIVVQWSGLGRREFVQAETNWYWCEGNLDYSSMFTPEFLRKYHNIAEKGYEYIHHNRSIHALGKLHGTKVIFTNMMDPTLSFFYGEPGEVKWFKPLLGSIRKYFPADRIKQMMKELDFATSITEFQWDNPSDQMYLFTTDGVQDDDHPSPIQHLLYARYLANRMGVSEDSKIWNGEVYDFAEVYEKVFGNPNIDADRVIKRKYKDYFNLDKEAFIYLIKSDKAIKKHLNKNWNDLEFTFDNLHDVLI